MIGETKERIGLFIDGANMYAATKSLEFDVDYKRLHKYFASKGRMLRGLYYTAVLPDTSAHDPLRPLLDYLVYNGWSLRTKEAKQYTNAHTGVLKTKGNMDIEMCVDIMKLHKYLDHVYLFSGDGDFTSLVAYVQELGVRVTIVSTIKSKPSSMTADELRRQADAFIDLVDIRSEIERRG